MTMSTSGQLPDYARFSASKASSRINKFGITNLIYFLLLPLRHFCREDKVAIFVKKQKQKTIKAIKVLSKLTR